jgi:hypothetical protein
MLVAMVAGMAVLGALVGGALALLGQRDLLDFAALRAFLMAGYMTAGMAVVMRYRGHSWSHVCEMGAAMFVPFLVLVGPFWGGVIGPGGLLVGGHVLMLPAMLGVMLLRREEYSRDHRQHASGRSAGTATHAAAHR